MATVYKIREIAVGARVLMATWYSEPSLQGQHLFPRTLPLK